jgi:hypothetical protein
VARARWVEHAGFSQSRAYTVSFRRLAAYLPGLVCPYRWAGLFIRWLQRLALAIVFSIEDRVASLRIRLTNFLVNAVRAKFPENPSAHSAEY